MPFLSSTGSISRHGSLLHLCNRQIEQVVLTASTELPKQEQTIDLRRYLQLALNVLASLCCLADNHALDACQPCYLHDPLSEFDQSYDLSLAGVVHRM